MIYLVHLSDKYISQNNLEKAISTYLESIDRTLVMRSDLTEFKQEVLAEIEELNQKFPKCKPAEAHWSSMDEDWTIHLLGKGVRNRLALLGGKEDRLV